MAKFIRIDMKGHWRGTEHASSLNGMAGEWENDWEEGISSYSLKDKAEAIENLREYWMDIAMLTKESDYNDMQITIFEGEKIGEGSDYEDIATCENTVSEIEASEFMSKVLDAYEQLEDEDISEDEYNEILEGLVK